MLRFPSRLMLVAAVSWSLLAGSVAPVLAQEATPGATPAGGDSLLAELGYPEFRVTTDGTTHDIPTEVEAGRYHVVFANQSNLDIDLGFGQSSGDATALATPPTASSDLISNGGLYTVAGETKHVVLDLTPGAWIVNLFMFDPATNEDTNTSTTITVTGEMPNLDEPPGQKIAMIDRDFVVSQPLKAGPHVWHLTNQGQEPHQLTLDRVPEGTTEDQVIALYSTLFGLAATPGVAATPSEPALRPEDLQPVFFGVPLSPGRFNLVELDLAPGTYALTSLMSVPPDDTPEVMLGMVEIVVVE